MGASNKDRITRSDLGDSIAAEFELTKKLGNEIVERVFERISAAVHADCIVTIHNFGTFRATEGGGYTRRGYNIKRTRRVIFKCSRMQKVEV